MGFRVATCRPQPLPEAALPPAARTAEVPCWLLSAERVPPSAAHADLTGGEDDAHEAGEHQPPAHGPRSRTDTHQHLHVSRPLTARLAVSGCGATCSRTAVVRKSHQPAVRQNPEAISPVRSDQECPSQAVERGFIASCRQGPTAMRRHQSAGPQTSTVRRRELAALVASIR